MGGWAGGGATLADIITGYGKQKADVATAQEQPALIRSQTEHNQALADQERQKAELMRRQAADSLIAQRAYASVDPTADYKTMMNQVRSAAIKGGMSASGIMALDSHHADLLSKHAQTSEHERATDAANHAEVGNILMGIRALPPDQQPAAWQQAAPRLAQLEPGAGFTPQFPGADHFNALIGAHALSGKILGEQKVGADLAQTQAQTAEIDQKRKFEAELHPFKQAEAQAEQDARAREDFARQHPEDEAAQLAAVDAARRLTIEREKRLDAEAKSQHAATNANERARIDLERQRNDRENKIYEATYGSGADPALTAVDPKARNAARAAALKAGQEYNAAQKTADEMDNFIKLAKAGNKAAQVNLPVAGVLEITTANGVKRINKTEVDAYGSAGSIFDRLAGKVGKAFSGAAIPKEVLNDIEQMHKAISESSYHAYERGLANVNQTYRSNFQPVKTVGTTGKMIRARDPQGVLHEAPEGTPLPAGWKPE